MPTVSSKRRTGHDRQSWPVLLLLLTVVLVPTAGVLWFMSQAMHNEQLAVRQRLRDAYQSRLAELQQALGQHWQTRAAALDDLAAGSELAEPVTIDAARAAQAFDSSVRNELADSLILYDADGGLLYPIADAASVTPGQTSAAWRRAEQLEQAGEHATAATAYAAIAAQAGEPNRAARAFLAQTRCLVRAGRASDAIATLAETLASPLYRDATDAQGRLIAPNALLRALELLATQDQVDRAARRERVAASLLTRLLDDDAPPMPAGQRRFLLQELIAASAELPRLASTLAPARAALGAEILASRYLETATQAPSNNGIQPTELPGIWQLASPSGRVTALYDQDFLTRTFTAFLAEQTLPEDTTVELLPPGTEAEGTFLVARAAGAWLPDWQLVLRPLDQTLFAAAASQRIHGYLLIGGLVILAVLSLAILVGRVVERQLRLTRLKNDLLATVSHELKTPLASTRLLVDTLLETGVDDTQRVREYLSLIAKENARLSRLVDNFLTFSRLEKDRQQFDMQRISARRVIESAADSFRDRLPESEHEQLTVEVEPALPFLDADPDALETVLLNLLDNAHKYAAPPRKIVLRGYARNGAVCLETQDNGMGIASRDQGKIFDRFFQADQTLSRPGSGCGLGLSIVARIVRAHQGTVEVDSHAGAGSTFTVRLPPAPTSVAGPDTAAAPNVDRST